MDINVIFIKINIFPETAIMVYINILLGVGCVVAAAAIAIYYSMPTANPPQRTGQRRRRDNNENNDSVQKINLRNLGKR